TLLPSRSEHACIGSVELDEDVVPMGAHQRLAASQFCAPVTLERGHQSRRFGRLSHRAAIAQLDLVSLPSETWIDAADLRLQRCRRPPPPIDQLHAHLGELLVPGTEFCGHVTATSLEHGISAREDLAEASQRGTMAGVEPGCDAIEKIATQGRRASEHF